MRIRLKIIIIIHPITKITHLCTKLEVDHDNTDLGTGHHQNDEDQEEEAKQVVKLVLPDSLVGNRQHLTVE